VSPFDESEDVESEEGVAAEALPEREALPPEGLETEAPVEIEEADVPDWLRGVTPPPESARPSVSAFAVEESEEEEEPAEESQPLEGSEDEEIPDWLRALTPTSDEVAAPGEPPEGLEQADVPRWLQNLRPPGTGPLPQRDLPPESAGGVEEDLAPAEIPAWVQELRPTGEVPEEAPPFEAFAEEPAEMEGPLAGLQGMLPALPMVDVPAKYEPRPRSSMPESVVQDAQLWQHLLEQPRGRERPVARRRERPGWTRVLVRLFLLLMLLGVAFVSFWDLIPFPLAQPPEQAGVDGLRAALEARQPGETVILAVEYGPAQAGEMEAVAETLLTHLGEREIDVVAVSTLPQGEAIARQLFVNDDAHLVEASYLPGGASALPQFLESADADFLMVIAGRSERLRWWVEQNATLGTGGLPMGVAVSASVGPLAFPYLDTSNVQGWMIGYPGVAAYRQARGIAPDFEITRRLNALMLAQWGGAGLLLAGAVYSLVAGRKGRM
ncbi:MAG: hypothetical protein ACP5GX_01895, partial [Anaerolineae bacterium]